MVITFDSSRVEATAHLVTIRSSTFTEILRASKYFGDGPGSYRISSLAKERRRRFINDQIDRQIGADITG